MIVICLIPLVLQKLEVYCNKPMIVTFIIPLVLLVSVLISVIWNENYIEHIQKLELYCNKPMTFNRTSSNMG
jgi:hypothetical protein